MGDYTDPDTLRHLYHDRGLSLAKIGARFDVADDTVWYHMKKHDIDRRRAFNDRPPYYGTTPDGYCRIQHHDGESNRGVMVHRLLAVAEYGFDAVVGNVTHHRNGIKWDNRPENIELMPLSEHTSIHHTKHERQSRDDPSQAYDA